MNPIAFLMALAAAIMYPLAILFLKRVLIHRVSIWQVSLYANLIMALMTLPFFFFLKHPLTLEVLFHGTLCGTTFFLGQISAFAALQRGDVSIATPLLGTKVILVALFAPLLAFQSLRTEWIFAAVICSIGIFLISSGKIQIVKGHSLIKTIVYSLIAATTFAVTDVLIQRFASKHELMAFVPLQFGVTALLSALFFIPIFGWNLLYIPRISRTSLLSGAFLGGLQAGSVCIGIALFRDATSFNIVYNTRSVFAVVLVALVGSHFGVPESKMPAEILRRRLLGASLIFVSIVLVVA